MRIRYNDCDCAGTAPGFPQHEGYCASIAPESYDHDEAYERPEDHPSHDEVNPWSDPRYIREDEDAPPFE